jgi:coproporphyrinogen III oxidase
MMDKNSIAGRFKKLQDHICSELENLDGQSFREDSWTRENGGGGRTRIIQGAIIEKGGVNFSEVYGEVTPMMRNNTEINADEFFASGVSIVLHPHSPHIPIIHMNVRYFELSNGKYWFGGGIDLTPHYINIDLARSFHLGLKATCDKYDLEYYPKFKDWADDYFFLPHRNETRGVGGIFFDHLSVDSELGKEELLNFCVALGELFPILYTEQVEAGIDKKIEEHQKEWQMLRRSRYVEFNLVHDRGTKFGLVSGGRTESILMSMPPIAQWKYDFHPEENSEEAFTQSMLQKGIDFLL